MATGKDAVLTMLALDMCYVMGNGHNFFLFALLPLLIFNFFQKCVCSNICRSVFYSVGNAHYVIPR